MRRGQEGQEVRERAVVGAGRGVVGREGSKERGQLVGEEGRGKEFGEEVGDEAVCVYYL